MKTNRSRENIWDGNRLRSRTQSYIRNVWIVEEKKHIQQKATYDDDKKATMQNALLEYNSAI